MKTKKLMEKAASFHGHSCPGLAVGVLASKYVLEHGNDFSRDEELVAVVENDNCSVDAIQALLGITFGKGNLKFLDYGKNNYTFYNRTNKKAVRLSIKKNAFGDRTLPKQDRVKLLLTANPEDIFEINEVEFNPPEEARVHESIACEKCGEPTMATRIQSINGKKLCVPCSEKLKNEK